MGSDLHFQIQDQATAKASVTRTVLNKLMRAIEIAFGEDTEARELAAIQKSVEAAKIEIAEIDRQFL